MSSIDVVAPADGSRLGRYPAAGPAEVAAALAVARAAAAGWSARSVADRVAQLRPLRQLIVGRTDEIVAELVRVTGKVPTEALLGEVYPVLELLRYYERQAPKVLAPRRVATPPLAYPFAHAYVEQRPHGVVAVISPWNFPFQLALIPTVTALLAGNSVCLKPSELSLPIGDLLRSLFDAVPELAPLVQILPGAGETGRLLVEAGPDLIFFTGSVATGRRIMAAAAPRLTPLILELGGKDPLLVFDDAHLARAVRAAVYGAFSSSGQMCIAVERAFVQRGIYPAFVEAAVAETAKLRVGADGELGAMTSPSQIAIVEAHYRDAVARGAKASGPLRRDGNYLHPVVLWDVHPDMRLMREETFGPLLPVMPFETEDEAIQLANDCEFGLNGSIFTGDPERGRRVAARLNLGGCAVNDVIKNAGHPGLPFGGVKSSGFGRYHGPEGLLAFSRPTATLANSGRMDTEPNWFPYGPNRYGDLRGFVDFVFGEGSLADRFRRNRKALMSFRQFFTFNLRQKMRQP